LLLGLGWFLVALFVGETQLLSLIPGPAAQVTLTGLTVMLLTLFGTSQAFRSRVNQVHLRTLILFHLVRFVGIYFLVLNANGDLPSRFAVPAGWGDIAIALGAVALLSIPGAIQARWAVLTWNTLGLIDILFAVSTAAGIASAAPNAMGALTVLPLSFLPTMIVPLIIASHVVIFFRLTRKKSPTIPEPQPQSFSPVL
jgi:hypothetical protein